MHGFQPSAQYGYPWSSGSVSPACASGPGVPQQIKAAGWQLCAEEVQAGRV
jgi:hypothetical protein